MQLENLQLAANAPMAAVNTRGPLLNNYLHNVLACVQEITLHGIHRDAVMALAAAQVQTGHDLRTMELGFPMTDDPDMHEDQIKNFNDATTAIVDITSAQHIINKVFE